MFKTDAIDAQRSGFKMTWTSGKAAYHHGAKPALAASITQLQGGPAKETAAEKRKKMMEQAREEAAKRLLLSKNGAGTPRGANGCRE